jgi:cell wall-associated NlpC family hydrolase
MRRPLSVLVLAVTIAAGLPSSCLAAVIWPSPTRQTSHDAKVRKLARKVVAYARHQLGVPYSWGGASPSTGFDCSGLVYAAYRSIGRAIPHSSWAQLRMGRPIGFRQLRPGDLLFTEGGGHVQLVVSTSSAISAPQTGERVRYVPLVELRPEFAGARRLLK